MNGTGAGLKGPYIITADGILFLSVRANRFNQVNVFVNNTSNQLLSLGTESDYWPICAQIQVNKADKVYFKQYSTSEDNRSYTTAVLVPYK